MGWGGVKVGKGRGEGGRVKGPSKSGPQPKLVRQKKEVARLF